MVRVKICGIRTWEEARLLLDLGIDNLGFRFAPGTGQISPEAAREIILKLPPFTTVIGVFINEPRYSLLELATFCRLNALQLQGEESPQYCEHITPSIIKGLPAGNENISAMMASYPQVKGFVLDVSALEAGAVSDRSSSWEKVCQAVAGGRPIILRGIATPEHADTIVRAVHPYALDIAAADTMNRCCIDPQKTKAFLQAISDSQVGL